MSEVSLRGLFDADPARGEAFTAETDG
ncbi:hypothetical protein, partial [Frankia sp. CpI1-P]